MRDDKDQRLATVNLRYPTGTVRTNLSFDPDKDAFALQNSFNSTGPVEKVVIEITGKRTNSQRQEIKEAYKSATGQDLDVDLTTALKGDVQALTLALYEPSGFYDARCLNQAVKGVGTTESVLIEIMTTRSNSQIRQIRKAYQALYHADLEENLADDTSGDFRKLLLALCKANRDERQTVEEEQAKADAKALYKAGEKKIGTDEEVFIDIFTSRSFSQLATTFLHYQHLTGKDIAKSVKSEFSGDVREGLNAIVEVARRGGYTYYAQLLHESTEGRHNAKLIRLLVAHCEVDMTQIKEAFKILFDRALCRHIADHTTGYFRQLLLNLIH